MPTVEVRRVTDGALLGSAELHLVDRILEGELDGPVTIPAGQTWLLGRAVTEHNVIVQGRLLVRPGSHLRLRAVEHRFVGGHTHHPLASDVGLWVPDGGVLDACGTPKTPWTRATGGLTRGQRTVDVEDADGWQVGDLVAITPTIPPTPDSGKMHQDVLHCLAYDEARITAIDGRRVTLDRALLHDHPAVPIRLWDGTVQVFCAEVLNLTRDAVIEGDPLGRSHIQFLHNHQRQHISHVEIRHMGPRQTTGKETGVLGRYPLHFHMCGDGSRGSVIEGVVVHDCGNRAFVPHDSHGITFNRCVAHRTKGDAFWWDTPSLGGAFLTDDTTWRGCVASAVQVGKNDADGYRMGGFALLDGRDRSNGIEGCVSVGVCDYRSTAWAGSNAGVVWTSDGRAIWRFAGMVSHNNGGAGSFAWQNDENIHLIERLIAYHNGTYGIDHGAYSNFWHYRDCALHGNRRAGLAIHAVTRATNTTIRYYPPPWPKLTFENFSIAASPAGVTSPGHVLAVHWDRDGWTLLRGIHIADCAVGHLEPALEKGSWLRFEHLEHDGVATPWLFAPGVAADVRIDVANADETFTLRAPSWPKGDLNPAWGARVVHDHPSIPQRALQLVAAALRLPLDMLHR